MPNQPVQVQTRNSQLNKDETFSHESWLGSIFNSGSVGGFVNPHAVLLIEGIKREPHSGAGMFDGPQETLFVAQYEITAATIGNLEDALRRSASVLGENLMAYKDALANMLQNTPGIITSIRAHKGVTYTRPGGYGAFKNQSVSYSISPPEKAEDLMRNIEAEKTKIENAWANGNLDELPKYQFRGATHPLGDRLGGRNCSEWCYMHLNDARITEDSCPKPPKNFCMIL